MSLLTSEISSCDIKVDKEGTWYYKGTEIIQRGIVELFYQHLEQDEQGRYIIHWQDKKCYLEVEDTPFVVWETRLVGEAGSTRAVLLYLSDATEEELDPSTLHIGLKDVPYCQIRGGRFPARFSRKAYYQLAALLEEDHRTGVFYITIESKRYYIHYTQREE